MNATVKTNEVFDKQVTSRESLEAEIQLRIKAGAIRSVVKEEGSNWVLVTEWNVMGQQ